MAFTKTEGDDDDDDGDDDDDDEIEQMPIFTSLFPN